MIDRGPTRNLGLELVRVTESAALSAAHQMGRGDKIASDKAAVDAMRLVLNSIEMDGVIVIGEGEKDEAPMLYNGEKVGTGSGPQVDIAVDPIDGTRLLSTGNPTAIATVAISPRGTMYNPGPFVYMNKLAVGPEAKGKVDIEAPVIVNLKAIARARGKDLDDLTCVILDRPRNAEMVAEMRQAGVRIRLLSDGDVAGALMTTWGNSGIDALFGIGGTPEGVLSACALRAMGGELQGKLYARNDDELRRGLEMGYDFHKVLTMDDLVSSEDVFFAATGITQGELLRGVKYTGSSATTDSIEVRGLTGTFRQIRATHRLDRLNALGPIQY